MRSLRTTLGVLACGSVLALPAGPTKAHEPTRPKLTGRWQLNKELSEDARAKLAEMRGRGGDRGGPPGGGMGGRVAWAAGSGPKAPAPCGCGPCSIRRKP